MSAAPELPYLDPNSLAARSLASEWFQPPINREASEPLFSDATKSAVTDVAGATEFDPSLAHEAREAIGALRNPEQQLAAAMVLAGFERSFLKSTFGLTPRTIRTALENVRTQIEARRLAAAEGLGTLALVTEAQLEKPANPFLFAASLEGRSDTMVAADLSETVLSPLNEAIEPEPVAPIIDDDSLVPQVEISSESKPELDPSGSYDAQDIAAHYGLTAKAVRTIITKLIRQRKFFGHPRPITRARKDTGQKTDQYKGETLQIIRTAVEDRVRNLKELEAARHR